MKNLEYKIEKKKAFKIAGFNDRFSFINEKEDYDAIAKKWANLSEEKMNLLFPLMNGEIPAFLGVVETIDTQEFQYTIAVSTNEQSVEGMYTVEVPELSWLILPCVGPIANGITGENTDDSPSAMIELKNFVLFDWLEKQGFKQANQPRIEIYPQGDMTAEDYQSELWIPIVDNKG